MNSIQRKAEFYAKLASIEKLESLERWQKEGLMLDAVRAGLIHSLFGAMKAVSKNKRFLKSWGDSDIPGPWMMIWDIHPWARTLIGDLVDKGEADVREFEKKITKYLLRSEIWRLDRSTRRVVVHPTVGGIIFDGLREVIQADPFLFDRCHICENIFVPGKNQKYCGKSCATKALAPWKAKYMKTYMSERRKIEKKGRSNRRS
ncbi:MAG: hypothetical protein Q8S00_26405 [Deltaproteobacteria bacterium]|nr:hypothetical protein [Deltaproteobacteria bacterium]